jgi:hypothetical protein
MGGRTREDGKTTTRGESGPAIALQRVNEPIVVSVGANRNLVAFQETERAICSCNADGVNGFAGVNSLKIQTRMCRIVEE